MIVKPIKSITSEVNITHAPGLSRDFTFSFCAVYNTKDLLLNRMLRNHETLYHFNNCNVDSTVYFHARHKILFRITCGRLVLLPITLKTLSRKRAHDK